MSIATVTIDELREQRRELLQRAIRDHVDSVLPRDEREIALADYCDMLLSLLGGGFVDGEAATLLQAKKNFTMRARVAGVQVKTDCDACETLEQLAAVVVDFDAIGGI